MRNLQAAAKMEIWKSQHRFSLSFDQSASTRASSVTSPASNLDAELLNYQQQSDVAKSLTAAVAQVCRQALPGESYERNGPFD